MRTVSEALRKKRCKTLRRNALPGLIRRIHKGVLCFVVGCSSILRRKGKRLCDPLRLLCKHIFIDEKAAFDVPWCIGGRIICAEGKRLQQRLIHIITCAEVCRIAVYLFFPRRNGEAHRLQLLLPHGKQPFPRFRHSHAGNGDAVDHDVFSKHSPCTDSFRYIRMLLLLAPRKQRRTQ